MADRLDFEIDVELEAGLITGHAGVPGLTKLPFTATVANGRDGGKPTLACYLSDGAHAPVGVIHGLSSTDRS